MCVWAEPAALCQKPAPKEMRTENKRAQEERRGEEQRSRGAEKPSWLWIWPGSGLALAFVEGVLPAAKASVKASKGTNHAVSRPRSYLILKQPVAYTYTCLSLLLLHLPLRALVRPHRILSRACLVRKIRNRRKRLPNWRSRHLAHLQPSIRVRSRTRSRLPMQVSMHMPMTCLVAL